MAEEEEEAITASTEANQEEEDNDLVPMDDLDGFLAEYVMYYKINSSAIACTLC